MATTNTFDILLQARDFSSELGQSHWSHPHVEYLSKPFYEDFVKKRKHGGIYQLSGKVPKDADVPQRLAKVADQVQQRADPNRGNPNGKPIVYGQVTNWKCHANGTYKKKSSNAPTSRHREASVKCGCTSKIVAHLLLDETHPGKPLRSVPDGHLMYKVSWYWKHQKQDGSYAHDPSAEQSKLRKSPLVTAFLKQKIQEEGCQPQQLQDLCRLSPEQLERIAQEMESGADAQSLPEILRRKPSTFYNIYKSALTRLCQKDPDSWKSTTLWMDLDQE